MIGRVDRPVRGALFIHRKLLPYPDGRWRSSGIRSIEATIDGEPRGRIVYGSLRADIGKRRHQYANADHCGFYGSVLLVGSEGNHELVTLITANDGQQLELPTRIEIESGNFIDGGVPVINRHYAWLERRTALQDAIETEQSHLPSQLSFEALVPLEGDCEDALEAVVASMQSQTYSRWGVTALVDSGTASDAAREYARHLARQDGGSRTARAAMAHSSTR